MDLRRSYLCGIIGLVLAAGLGWAETPIADDKPLDTAPGGHLLYGVTRGAPDAISATPAAGSEVEATGSNAFPQAENPGSMHRDSLTPTPAAAQWSGRSVGFGCNYTLAGKWTKTPPGTGGNGDKPKDWESQYYYDAVARIGLSVSPAVVASGQTAIATVSLFGGADGTSYAPTLTTDNPLAGQTPVGTATITKITDSADVLTTQNRCARWTITGGTAGYLRLKATCSNVVAGNSPQYQDMTVWKAEIADSQNNVVTTTQKTIVGKRVTLKGKITPSSLTPTAHGWTVGGDPIKNYTQTLDEAKKIPLGADDLKLVQIGFYWIAGSGNVANTVKYTATIGSQSSEATAGFDVSRPSATLSSETTPLKPPLDIRGDYFRFGDGVVGDIGIIWNASATTGVGGAGQLAFVQTLEGHREKTTENGGTEWTLGGAQGTTYLDTAGNSVQYDGGTKDIGDGKTETYSKNDTPGTPWKGTTRVSVDEHFHVYFMYRPAGDDSIWVTLSKLNWFWKGTATFDMVWLPEPGQSSSADAPGNPSGSDSTELPEWTAHYQSQTWQTKKTN